MNEQNTTPQAADTPAAPPTPPAAAPTAPQVPTEAPAAPSIADVPSAPSLDAPATTTATVAAPEPADAQGWWHGTGRRKSAVARVRIKPGKGEIKIKITAKKYKTVEVYFTEPRDRNDAIAPLKATDNFGKLDVIVRLGGGGYMGQAQAMMLGVARALKKFDPSTEPTLRSNNFLTRDPREVERKKYGQAGARAKFQFSKR